jgi:hypothetical protein
MVIKKILRTLINLGAKIKSWAEENNESLYEKDFPEQEPEKEIRSLWDFLSFTENTQAYHLVNVLGFDEWIDMQEIRRRIKELFGVEYKNERSLYPYLKTLVDINLIETMNIGGRRKWRKKELLFEIAKESAKEGKKEKKKEKVAKKVIA